MSADRQDFLKLTKDIFFQFHPKKADKAVHINFSLHPRTYQMLTVVDKCLLCLCSNLDKDRGGKKATSSSDVVVDVEMIESLGKCSQVGIFIKSEGSGQSFMRWLAILT